MVATVSAKNNIDTGERYYYAFLTENCEVGEESKHTPQHITLIPPFMAEVEEALEVAEAAALEFSPFNIDLGDHAMFGPNKDIPVIVIKPNAILQALHMALLSELEVRDIKIPSNRFLRVGFTPHISLKSYHPVPDETQPINVDHIAVMHKFKNIKTVLAKNVLGRQ
jgi:2'-5' RNA ligase